MWQRLPKTLSRMGKSLALPPRLLPRQRHHKQTNPRLNIPQAIHLPRLPSPIRRPPQSRPTPNHLLPRQTNPLPILPPPRPATRRLRSRPARSRSPPLRPNTPRTRRRWPNNRMPPLQQNYSSPRYEHAPPAPRSRTRITPTATNLSKPELRTHTHQLQRGEQG